MKRPKFLTTLCLLSFIGIGSMLMIDIIEYAYINHLVTSLLDVSNMRVPQIPDLKLQQIPEDARALSAGLSGWNVAILIMEIMELLFCLWGVLSMWKMHKKGFFIYLTGQLALIITLVVFCCFFYFLGNDISASNIIKSVQIKMEGFFAVITLIWLLSPIISIVFILLYRMNLKYLE